MPILAPRVELLMLATAFAGPKDLEEEAETGLKALIGLANAQPQFLLRRALLDDILLLVLPNSFSSADSQ